MSSYSELAQVVEAIPILLRECRRTRGLSLRAAASQLGASFNTVTRIEAGEDYNSRILPALLRWLGDSPVKSPSDLTAADLAEMSMRAAEEKFGEARPDA